MIKMNFCRKKTKPRVKNYLHIGNFIIPLLCLLCLEIGSDKCTPTLYSVQYYIVNFRRKTLINNFQKYNILTKQLFTEVTIIF